MAKPKIGEPRVYPPGPLPLLYPGERATATACLKPEDVERHEATGEPIDLCEHLDGWLVTPMPGLYGWFLRARYRLLARFRREDD